MIARSGPQGVLELAASLRAGERGVREALQTTLERIDAHADLGCFLSIEREQAERRALELERARAAGEPLGPLFGVPFALKANMCLAGFEASCGSKILAGYRPPYTATFVQRLLDAGALPVGTTNMDEFAMGSSGENSAFGPARNPWDRARSPGGSSSGSAAAVAAGLVPFALGSDTGGSVRLPAALCGLSGFKPTYGRVSRYGLIAFGSSLDHVAPLARTVTELAAVLSVLSGADPCDSTCLDLPPLEPPTTPESLAGLVIGVPEEYLPTELDGGVRAAVEAALAELAGLGATLRPVRLPHTPVAIPTYYVVATAEAASNLARYDGVRYGARSPGDGTLQGMFAQTRADHFGPEVVRRILLGTYVLSRGYYDAWYARALKVRRLVRNDFDAAFAEVDLIAGPTAPAPAGVLGEHADDPLAMYLHDVMTVPASLSGLPALSMPCGFARVGGRDLPVGLQLVGPHLSEGPLLRLAHQFQRTTDWHSRFPAEFD